MPQVFNAVTSLRGANGDEATEVGFSRASLMEQRDIIQREIFLDCFAIYMARNDDRNSGNAALARDDN